MRVCKADRTGTEKIVCQYGLNDINIVCAHCGIWFVISIAGEGNAISFGQTKDIYTQVSTFCFKQSQTIDIYATVMREMNMVLGERKLRWQPE